MDLPLPPAWNDRGLTRHEMSVLSLASVPAEAMRKRQRLLVAVGLWFVAGAVLIAALADILGWSIDAWSPVLAVPGMVLLLRAWDMRNMRATRRVLRRLCGQDPE